MLFFLVAALALGQGLCFVQLRHRRAYVPSAALRMQSPNKETVVVTGLGLISPCGSTAPVFFDSLLAGKSGISKLDRFDARDFKCQIAGQVRDFDPKAYYRGKKKIKQNDLYTHFAVAASHIALADAGIDLSAEANTVDATRVGVIIGSAFGGMQSFEDACADLARGGPGAVQTYTIPMILGNTAAGIVGMETGAKGPNFGVQTACATATHAFGEALRLMRNGDADVMIAGGSEAAITPLSFAGFCNLLAMNFNYNDNPTEVPPRSICPLSHAAFFFVYLRLRPASSVSFPCLSSLH